MKNSVFLYLIAVLLLASNNYATEKNITLQSRQNQCKYSFAKPSNVPILGLHQINRHIMGFPAELKINFFLNNRIKSLENYLEYHNKKHKNLVRFLESIQANLHPESAQHELLAWNIQRLENTETRNINRLESLVSETEIPKRFIPMRDVLNRKEWRKLFYSIVWNNKQKLGLLGEIIAGLEVNRIEKVESKIHEILKEEDILVLQQHKLWKKTKEFEIDLVADSNKHWVEVKYLTPNFDKSGSWAEKLYRKISSIDEAIRLLNRSPKNNYRFTLLVYGKGQLSPAFFENLATLNNVKVVIRDSQLSKLEIVN